MPSYFIEGFVLLLLLLLSAQVYKLGRAKNDPGDDETAVALRALEQSVERGFARIEHELRQEFRQEMGRGRTEAATSAHQSREAHSASLSLLTTNLGNQVGQLGNLQGKQLEAFAAQLAKLTLSNEQRFGELRQSVEARLSAIQLDNASKLEEMRKTVDEKLHATLEQRLGESFKQVSERLEQVHKGLGEMQSLAVGVGDLKKVLTNVKTRGTWGEVQLQALLDQVLTAEQYATNVATRPGSSDRVEFAIRLPGRGVVGESGDGAENPVWLPIDAKVPMEDYQRLFDAQERADPIAVEIASKALEARIRLEAKTIHDKYVEPPHTTDFAILYLPTEGLYAEVLRRPGLADLLQREFRISLAGPTTLAALLNSLQMGFRTLAIEKRSSEVWRVLGAVKTEFGKFGDVLEATRRKLEQATKSIESAGVRTRQIERKLKNVEELPLIEAKAQLGALEEAALVGDEESLF